MSDDYWLRYRLSDLKAQIIREEALGRNTGLVHAARRMIRFLEDQEEPVNKECKNCGKYIDNHNHEIEWLHQPGSQRWCEYASLTADETFPQYRGMVAEPANSEDDVDPKATDPNEKLNLSDWDKLNNEVTALIGNSQVHNKHILSLFEKVGDLTETTTKLMDALETQLGSIRDLHDTVKTQTGMIERTNETVSGHGGVLDKMIDTVTSQSRSIERLLNNTADLQKRVKSLEVREATNYLPIKDTGKGTNISVNIPQTTQPTKDNTSKLLLKRFLAVQRICEASIDLDTKSAVAPSTDRQWLAQSVLNILKGNVDE